MNNLNEQLRENADVIYFSENIVMCQQKLDIIQTKTIKERTYIICFYKKNFGFNSQSKHYFYGFVEKIRYLGLEYIFVTV